MRTKRQRGLTGGLEIDRLHLSLTDASFAEFERVFLTYARKSLRDVRSQGERLEFKRRIAESILLGAVGRRCSWKEFHRALQRIQRLGYTDVGKRAEVAAHFALCVGRFPEQARQAQAMVDEAERRLRFVSKRHFLRKEWMKELGRIRRMARW